MAWAPAGRFRPFCSEQLLRTVPQLQATALIHTRAVVTDGPRGHSSYEDQSLAKGRCCSGVSGNVIERGHILAPLRRQTAIQFSARIKPQGRDKEVCRGLPRAVCSRAPPGEQDG